MAAGVVSLVPSVTESLLAWGVTPLACTRFCEQPTLLHVGGTKDPDVAAIVALDPDVVVMCDEENRREDADVLVAAGLRVHSCSPRSVIEVGPAMGELAATVGAPPPPDAGLPVLAPLDLRAFVPIWRRPWMSIAHDTYGASVLDAIGVEVVAGGGDGRYPEVTLDAVRAGQPDVVLAPSEPYAFRPRHLEELAELALVIPVDGQDLFWWGTRTPAAIVRLHTAISARQSAFWSDRSQ